MNLIGYKISRRKWAKILRWSGSSCKWR